MRVRLMLGWLLVLSLLAAIGYAQEPAARSLSLTDALVIARRNNPDFLQTLNDRWTASRQLTSATANLLTPSVDVSGTAYASQAGERSFFGQSISIPGVRAARDIRRGDVRHDLFVAAGALAEVAVQVDGAHHGLPIAQDGTVTKPSCVKSGSKANASLMPRSRITWKLTRSTSETRRRGAASNAAMADLCVSSFTQTISIGPSRSTRLRTALTPNRCWTNAAVSTTT